MRVKNYGMPYKGSKNKIAEKVVEIFPEADFFIDLFGGGGAITHCAALSGKYKHVIYNELEPIVFKGFKMAIDGEFRNESRWISREDFCKLKDTDPYVALCFSFGNNARGYAYSRNMERYKEAMHELFFEGQTKSILEYPFVDKESIEQLCKIEGRKERRLAYRSIVLKNAVSDGKNLERLQSLERLERLQSLERLERLDIKCFNLSYEQVEIPKNSVIYCDIPYKGTSKYLSLFDYNKFYSWAKKQSVPVYISEYSMPNDFECVAEIEKACSFGTKKGKRTVEKIFIPRKN